MYPGGQILRSSLSDFEGGDSLIQRDVSKAKTLPSVTGRKVIEMDFPLKRSTTLVVWQRRLRGSILIICNARQWPSDQNNCVEVARVRIIFDHNSRNLSQSLFPYSVYIPACWPWRSWSAWRRRSRSRRCCMLSLISGRCLRCWGALRWMIVQSVFSRLTRCFVMDVNTICEGLPGQ